MKHCFNYNIWLRFLGQSFRVNTRDSKAENDARL